LNRYRYRYRYRNRNRYPNRYRHTPLRAPSSCGSIAR
jgi:hypothetical protein